jgi:hypothetical protein
MEAKKCEELCRGKWRRIFGQPHTNEGKKKKADFAERIIAARTHI